MSKDWAEKAIEHGLATEEELDQIQATMMMLRYVLEDVSLGVALAALSETFIDAALVASNGDESKVAKLLGQFKDIMDGKVTMDNVEEILDDPWAGGPDKKKLH